jgi:hypothetical protein
MNAASLLLAAASGIDIFGDVHGQAIALESGLRALGYEDLSGTWRHTHGRKALFLGDLIDRGPNNRKVLGIVRGMVEEGEAVCIMGNHELNAVHFSSRHPDPQQGYLRNRSDKNIFQHIAFLHEYRLPHARESLALDLDFMRKLPIMVELDGLRAIHACWSAKELNRFKSKELSGEQRDESFWLCTASRGDLLYGAVEVLLKGPEQRLPDGAHFKDKDGHQRTEARVRWWSDSSDPVDCVIGPPSLHEAVRGLEEFDTSEFRYPTDERPVFFGHYWLTNPEGIPCLTRPANVQCLDFSVGSGRGQLGIYRWSGEEKLTSDNLLAVSADGSQVFNG